MTYALFVVGMAGSGKSSLTATYSEWLKGGDRDVLTANLDPGAIALPYNPDIDAFVQGFGYVQRSRSGEAKMDIRCALERQLTRTFEKARM